MAKFRLKLYTKYDDTDRIREMKDSDILAERKKKGPGYGSLVASTAGGVLAGATIGGLAGGGKGLFKKGGSMLKGAAKAGKVGAILGGVAAGALALRKHNKESKENQFYNDRLEYAQRQAKRREKKSWKQNMTQREDYTF